MEYNYGKTYSDRMKLKMLDVAAKCHNDIRIILNHMPLMDRTREEFQDVSIHSAWDVNSPVYFVVTGISHCLQNN